MIRFLATPLLFVLAIGLFQDAASPAGEGVAFLVMLGAVALLIAPRKARSGRARSRRRRGAGFAWPDGGGGGWDGGGGGGWDGGGGGD